MIGAAMLPVYRPFIPEASKRYAIEAIESGWISWRGKYVEIAEEKLSNLLGVRHVILTSSGTTAMDLVARCLAHFEGAESILVPNSVFVAAWNSFVRERYDMRVMDVNLDTWNADIPARIDADAILIVHNVGNIINVPALKRRLPGVILVEDACEALFGEYEGRPAGSASFCSAISFFANKNLTCGEGGAFLADDEAVSDFARKVRGQGLGQKQYHHDILGSNYRMTNVQAAILLGQIEDAGRLKDEKRRVFETYERELGQEDGILLQVRDSETVHANWIFALRIEDNPSYEEARDYFAGHDIETRPMFTPISAHPYLRHVAPNDESTSKTLSREVVMFPSYPELTDGDLRFICDKIRAYARGIER